MMQKYKVTGMSCAACQARVEKAVSAVPGVSSCTVSLLTNSMSVEGSASEDAVIRAVEKAGYGAGPDVDPAGSILADTVTPVMKRRLAASVILLLVLMYFSMGIHMFGWPIPPFIPNEHIYMGLIQLILSAVIMLINRRFFVSGIRGLVHASPNMDTLIALGSAAAFGYSVVTFAATGSTQDLYFESAAMILTLVSVGKTMEAYSKGRTTDAIKSLMKLSPKTANVIRDGIEQTVGIEDVSPGDIFVVRPGENIPADGVVIEGISAVNESALTGESIPVDKEPGSTVSTATINQSGFLKCRAVRVGEDTTLSQIISMVSDAAATKAPVAKLADKISLVFVPVVILLAVAVTVVWIFIGQTAGYALARGISVLVVSCPCALGLATPVAIMVGNGVGARHGILFKTAEALQLTGAVNIVALDKTGTITSGSPVVTDVMPYGDIPEEELITKAYSIENMSEHPLALAIKERATLSGIGKREVTGFEALPGNGLMAYLDGKRILGGSVGFVSSKVNVPKEIADITEGLAKGGKTPVLFAEESTLLGIMAIADPIKTDSASAIDQLRNMGIYTVMLTGDNENTAKAIGDTAGVDEVIAQVLPDGKEKVITDLQRKGKVAMIGDGINDAPALTRADSGIAIGAGTDVAIDAADVVLMRSELTDVAAAIRLSRKTYVNIKQNLFWALIYNVLLIPVACGLYAHWGITMNPMLGAAAMSISSLFVVTNALRLNFADIYDRTHDKKAGQAKKIVYEKGAVRMTKTVKIEGMMCTHCEASVKKALEAIEGIESAVASHEAGTAVIELTKDVAEEVIRKAIEDKDYRFIGIE